MRRWPSLRSAPSSWTGWGISNLGDLGQGAVPSLKVQPYANSVATLIISIRGVGAEDAGSITTESPVGVYVDGVYLGRGQGLGADILDLERLEVLRGPQGSLYGRNSLGGAVSFVTLKPSGEFGFKQKFTYGAELGLLPFDQPDRSSRFGHWRRQTERQDFPI